MLRYTCTTVFDPILTADSAPTDKILGTSYCSLHALGSVYASPDSNLAYTVKQVHLCKRLASGLAQTA